jgi:hypothetical protein
MKTNLQSELGASLVRLAEECRGRDVTLGELSERTGGRSPLLLVFLLALPFCQPVTLPGVSTPFGLLLFVLGWQMARGRELSVPERFQKTVIPKVFFPLLLSGAGWLLRWLEKHLRRRDAAFAEAAATRRFCGVNIAICALLLSLPLPIPFSNVFPALPVAIAAAALLESDGKVLWLAAVAAVINLFFWAGWVFLICRFGWQAVESFHAWLWA